MIKKEKNIAKGEGIEIVLIRINQWETSDLKENIRKKIRDISSIIILICT